MVKVLESKETYYTMMNIKEIEALLEFAKGNLSKTNDDRIILAHRTNSIGSTCFVANVDEFYKIQKTGLSFALNSEVDFKITDENMKDITDYSCW